MKMKTSILSRAAAISAPVFLVIAGAVLPAAAAPVPPTDKIDFLTAEKEFRKTGRNRRTPIREVSNTFARLLSSTNLTATTKGKATIEFGNYHSSRSLLEQALACFEEAFAAKDATPEVRVEALMASGKALSDANFRGGYATYRNDQLERASATYLRVLDVDGATAMDKVEALKAAARAKLDSRQDVDPAAEEMLVRATKLPDLTETELARARLILADYYNESLQSAKAMPILEELVAKAREKKFHVHFCAKVLDSYADAMLALEGFEATLRMMTEGAGKGHYGNRTIAGLCEQNGRQDLAIEYLRRDIPGPDKTPSARLWYMQRRLFYIYSTLGAAPFRAFIEKDVLPLLEECPDKWRDILLELNKRTLGSHGGSHTHLSWLLSVASKAPKGKGLPAADLLLLATRCRDTARAKEVAGEILASNDPAAEGYRTAGLTIAVIDADDGPGSVAKVTAFLDKSGVKGAKERGEEFLAAARIAMVLRHEKSARVLYGAYEKMLVRAEKPTLDCPFVPDAPQDISSILATDLYKKSPKGKLDRKYGEQLQFLLETDSAVTGRKVVKGEDGVPVPELFSFCDLFGVKFLIRAYMTEEEIENMKNGFGGAASYEAYLSPGIDSPYEFLFLSPPSNYGDGDGGFITQYDNGTGYRNLKPSEDMIDVSYQILDDSVVTMISIDWAPYFNFLPVDGSAWFFEPIIWTRGGLSWGGSESVHHRSSFGRIVFRNLTAKNLTAIKRRLLNGAVRCYRNAKSPRRNGQIEIWKDNELGDQDFYDRCVKPLCDRLDPYMGMVKASMSDEEVELVYEKAARTCYNIEYVILQLRRDYLDAKLTSGD